MAYSGKFFPNNPKKYTGDVNNIIYRSLWERTVMSKLDMWDVVLEWCSEELRIPYRSPLDQKIKMYFPDFVAKLKTPTGIKMAILEVKPKKQVLLPKKPKRVTKRYINECMEYERNQAKWAAARAYCAAKGWEFIILTEDQIYGPTHK
jgi:hypothetical protein